MRVPQKKVGKDPPFFAYLMMFLLGIVLASGHETVREYLKHWRAEGVQFISLDDALADAAYQINPNFAYSDGRNFLEQVADSRHVDISKFDDSTYTIERINEVCKPAASPQH